MRRGSGEGQGEDTLLPEGDRQPLRHDRREPEKVNGDRRVLVHHIQRGD